MLLLVLRQEYYAAECNYLLSMARKTLSVSEEAYSALYRAKGKSESVTEAILRLAGRGTKGSLVEYIRSTTTNTRVADSIEKILQQQNSVHVRCRHEEAVRKRQITKAAQAMKRQRSRSKD
jgi:predicted CopG family antitoxin